MLWLKGLLSSSLKELEDTAKSRYVALDLQDDVVIGLRFELVTAVIQRLCEVGVNVRAAYPLKGVKLVWGWFHQPCVIELGEKLSATGAPLPSTS